MNYKTKSSNIAGLMSIYVFMIIVLIAKTYSVVSIEPVVFIPQPMFSQVEHYLE